MATIKIKRGLEADLDNLTLAEGEMAFTTDTKKLYISNTANPVNNNTTYSLSKSGSTITLTGSDGSKTSVTDADTNTTYSAATQSAAGLMSATDKQRLDGITAGTKTPTTAGTAAVGTATAYAREDHVHAAQTTVSGNAGSATKLATARNLTIGKTAKSFNGTANVAWTLDEIGSNVYVGTAEPSDTDVDVWIDPTGSVDLSALWNSMYPVGSIYMSVNSTSPASLFAGTTWTQITDRMLMAAGSTYTNGNTGGAASVTLTTSHLPGHTHSFSATSGNQSKSHTHSLNSHTHGIPALSGTAAASTHTHLVTPRTTTYASGVQSAWRCLSFSGTNSDYAQNVWTNSGTADGSHTHSVTTTASTTDASSGSTGSQSASHTHSVSGTTGSTGSGSSFSILPPYLVVYMWKRTA